MSSGLVHAEMFREIRRLKAGRNLRKLADHFNEKVAGFVGDGLAGTVELVAHPQTGMRIRVVPRTLIGALWFQFWQRLSNHEFRVCRQCSAEFEVGPGGRRADAQFCCEEHKVTHFNEMRSRKRR